MKPKVQLSGQDGNVFNLMGLCKRAALKAGWTREQIDAFLKKCMNQRSYDDVLVLMMEEFDVR